MALNGWMSIALVALTIGLWATALLPEYLVALLFFATGAILQLAPPSVLFSGFSSTAFWLVLSGLVIGAAIQKVGLASRVAAALARHLSGSWPRMVGGVVLLSYLLAFVMPSNMGRIALLMPIVLALADQAGLKEGSRGRIALALAVGFGTYQLSASILPANVPNLVMAGAAESAFGVHLSYLPYFLLHAPVLGLLKGVLLVACLCRMFPATPKGEMSAGATAPLSREEKRLGMLLVVTLLLWVSDGLHGISPAWIGLGSACICLMPRVGFLNSDEFAKSVNWRSCIYVAGILGLAALVTHSGLGKLVGDTLIRSLPFSASSPGQNFGVLVGLSSILSLVVTANGVPALYTPLAQMLADVTGQSLPAVLMVQVFGYATPLLPYQAAPIVVAASMAKVPAKDATRFCLVIALVSLLLLVPIDYAWFALLGWFR